MKIVIIGNSGSGKSTLAKFLQSQYDLSLLDLDILAWKASDPPQREELAISMERIDSFTAGNKAWVIEGGYSDLIKPLLKNATKVIFLNPGLNSCIENCKNRPFESHKYQSMEEQNSNLQMLLAWVQEYYKRDDSFSYHAHKILFDAFGGEKIEYRSNDR